MSIETTKEAFKPRVEHEMADSVMRSAVIMAQERIGGNRELMVEELGNWESWRDRSEQIRNHVLENLDAYLYQLSENVVKNGGNVYFAKTADDATKYICEVAKKKNAKRIVKSKSMVTEEIGMNAALKKDGFEVIETDLGEYIIQVNSDTPSHIVVPAIHKNRTQIKKILSEKIGYEGSEKPEEITRFVRKRIREYFLTADIGITGCNFAVAETGSVCLVTNEGNGRMTTTLPKTQIAVMGMERLAPTFEEVDPLITMLCRSAVGTRLTSYNTWVTSPKLPGEVDGPEEFHLVIVDNGRSDILGSQFASVLRCIRCGACLNVCPAYRNIGGHAYGSVYPGPIGAVISPLLDGYKTFHDLPYACSLCNACNVVCPVKIPLAQLLLKHRRVMVETGLTPSAERRAIGMFDYINSHPTLWKWTVKVGAKMANKFIKNGSLIFKIGVINDWERDRDLPTPDGFSFRSWFKEHKK